MFASDGPPFEVEEGVLVAVVGERAVERRRGDRDLTERRAALGWVDDAVDVQPQGLSGRRLHGQGRAELQRVILGIPLQHERAVPAELRGHRVGAVRPFRRDDLRQVRVDAGDEHGRAADLGLAGADLRDRRDARCLDDGLRGLVRQRIAVVTGRYRVVGHEHVVDGTRERRLEALPDHSDERDQREADHHRGRRGGRPRRIADRVLAGQLARRAAEACAGSPEHVGERTHHPRRDHRHADEHQQDAGRRARRSAP